ncbi:putative baseplate assembly protein [Parerythrobacter aestuarii]|uniref:putative baseplate assembly protein n=1 Tax=Parerythrobacter aestuarii TaxID=3020909 RepID=UPI0024DED589|nr:putative baseplate assembly protein [Parerythrobacter aestuarii]
MPIPFYNLHDQTAEQLADEMIRQIPAHTPEWRNPAPGDPGRALIDLFAWMGDKLLYRINLLPERQRLMFLRLLDMPMRPATPARGLLQLRHATPKDTAIAEVPARTLVKGPVEFETVDAGYVLPVSGAVYVKRLPTTEESSTVEGIQQSLQAVYDLQSSAPYVTTPLFANGKAKPEGFDIARDTLDQSLWVALLAPEPPEDKAAFRDRVFTRNGNQPLLLNIGFAPQAEVPLEAQSIDAPKPRAENWVWQMPTKQVRPDGLPAYTTLAPPIANSTRGFTQSGVLRMVLPDAGDIGLPENDPDIDVLAGVGDRPPRIDDEAIAARLVGWIRMAPRERAETLNLSWLGINSVEIIQQRSLRNIVLGATTSGSDQVMQLPAQQVDADSFVLDVQRADGAYETWTRTDYLGGHARHDQVYQLDAEAGLVRFGNGVTGKVPPRGAKVRATQLRHGGGRVGNLPAQSIDAISHPRLSAGQPTPTVGGEDAETLAQAETRLPGFLRHGDRAVTEKDYKDLAPLTPGVDIARVEVLPRFKPYQRLSNVAGAVSVMVVPRPKHLNAATPRPDRAMLQAVQDYLDPRRLIGTELHVIGPEYKPVSVSAAIKVRDGAEPDKVLAAIEESLRLFLAPVEPGGREGTGWALGRTITNLELEVIIARLDGIEAVYGVNLFERSSDGTSWVLLPQEGSGLQSVALERWMLPDLAEVVLSQDPNGPAGSVESIGGGGWGGQGTPIPVVPEVC